MQIMMCEDLLW
uniref:Uncharacterized protein n=1 Tax=Anguilla anguilla TaxID=7936 RepID=A0A0E9W535_ANGAN